MIYWEAARSQQLESASAYSHFYVLPYLCSTVHLLCATCILRVPAFIFQTWCVIPLDDFHESIGSDHPGLASDLTKDRFHILSSNHVLHINVSDHSLHALERNSSSLVMFCRTNDNFLEPRWNLLSVAVTISKRTWIWEMRTSIYLHHGSEKSRWTHLFMRYSSRALRSFCRAASPWVDKRRACEGVFILLTTPEAVKRVMIVRDAIVHLNISVDAGSSKVVFLFLWDK